MIFGGAYVLWEDPLILGCWGTRELARSIAVRRAEAVLYWPSWLWSIRNIPELMKFRWQAYRGGKSLHFMRNTVEEEKLFGRFGMPGVLASSNCYVNENFFNIAGGPKKYDAIYSAQMAPFKRLHLAAKIPTLYVVTYGPCKNAAGEHDLHRFEPALSHADFNRTWVGPDDIARVINESRVGLALSEVEGAMLASVEYMLCGVPLVSTPCKGGREQFFDERFVSVVQPDADAVAAAVAEKIENPPDPQLVRGATLERMRTHRDALCGYVQNIIRKRAPKKMPERSEIYQWIFGDPKLGTAARFVLLKDFETRGLV
jgi:glycosyltransferase involved in cell wall biosynthesis